MHTVPRLRTADALVLPIEPYLFTDRQVTRLLRARGILTARCMRRYGHDWPEPPARSRGTGTLNPANTAHRYGLSSMSVAARVGYHPAAPDAHPAGKPEKSSGPSPGPEQMAALTGLDAGGTPVRTDRRGRTLPPGGCLGEATAALSGDPEKIGNRELVGAVNIGSYQRSQRDPRVREVFRAWSRCMAGHGHDYPDPTRVPGTAPEFGGPEAGAAELALARADVRCKWETNVIGVWFSVDAAYQRRAMGDHRRELAAVAQDIRRQLAGADRVLGRD
ncbi:hypothetical protein [Streptomyces sp. CAU 1734]|uniref:hypothetical protein n=1 Tax=Streptomyces sp. CAU 1734 TaxID=3140360 RepID=UPI0032610A5C